MAGHLAGRRVKPKRIDFGAEDVAYHPASTVAKWAILRATGKLGGTLQMDDTPDATVGGADARGPLFVALHAATPVPTRPNDPVARCSRFVVVGPVNTATTAVGDPIYLSDTPGTFSLSAGTVTRVIGSVLVVDATDGYWLFDGHMGAQVPV